MNSRIRRIIAVIAAVLVSMALSLQASAQSSHKVNLKLVDAEDGAPVSFATVSITAQRGQPKYVLSDAEGHAVVEKVKAGTYTLKVELLGYKTLSMEITVGNGNLDLGEIRMEMDAQMLAGAEVTAVGNPVIIKKDTVEYNAASFRPTDNDMLVDLLKKLPGIEVSEDGTITSNGETISKITIGGKTFFLDDPQLATQNIPAKLIEKVKVVKKKSEQAEFTGIDDGEDETVIDLSVKKGMMNGLFGNAMAGGGHDIPSAPLTFNDGDWRWQTAFMGGKFSESSQISVILNGNNTNNRGFNDMSGSMMNSMMGGGGRMGRGQGGFGRGGNGITTSWMGGVNGTWDLLDNKMELGANYLYNGTLNNVLEETYKETYLDDYTLISNNSGNSRTFTDGHRFGMRLEHKFSENTSIIFQPQFNFGTGNYDQLSEFNTLRADDSGTAKTNDGFTHNTGDNRNWQTRGFFLFRQKLGMPGRTLSVNVDWNLSNNFLDGYNQSLTNTAFDADGAATATDFVNQRIDQESLTRALGTRIVYTEPLGNYFYLEGSYNFRWNNSESEKLVYNSAIPYDYTVSKASMQYLASGETADDTYSNTIVNRSFNHNIGMALMYQREKFRAQLGMSAVPTDTYNNTNGKTYESHVWNFAPRAMVFYDFNDNSNVRLFYFGRSSQPSTSQLMPVMDNSNPLSMSLGNPYLLPYFNHGLRSNFEYSLKKKFFTTRVNLEGNYTQNPITNAVWYDMNGRSYSFPVNGNDTFNGNMRIMVNAPIARSSFTISNVTRLSYSKTGSYLGKSSLDMSSYFDANQEFDYEAFHSNYFSGRHFAPAWENDFQTNTTRTLGIFERLRATYRSDNLEVILGGRTRFSKPWYTVQAEVDPTWANQLSASVNWTVSYRLGLEVGSDINYNWYVGYTSPQPSELVWNATMQVPVFKRKATIALKAYDILDQAKNLTVTDTENYHQEVLNNTLGRYVILSFTWRFGNFGKAGEQMRSRMNGRGPMGGGPGGGGPRF